jgi:hypothetical protein
MTDFDRLAWLCTWVAPTSWLVAGGGFLLSLSSYARGAAGSWLQTAIPVIVFVAAMLALLAQTVLTLHVSRSRRFSSAERNALFRALWFGSGYRLWRDTMRTGQGHHQ